MLIAGGALTLLGVLFTPEIALLLGAKEALLEPSTEYLYGYFLGAIPTIMLSAMMSFIRLDGSHKLPLICIAVMSAANVALDLMMVYVFNMGMFGMALATTISYCLAVLTACNHFLKKGSALRLVMPRNICREMAQTIFTGFPTVINRLSETFKGLLLNHMLVAFVSVSAVTALNVRTTAQNLVGAIVLGISQAATPTIGMFFGEEDRTAVRDVFKATLHYGFRLVVAASALLLFFPSFFSSMLGVADGELMKLSDMAIRFYAIALPLSLFNTVLLNFYQATKRVGMSAMVCVLQSLIYTVLFALVLIRPFGANGVWAAFLLGEIFTLLTVIGCLMLKNKKAKITLDSLMMLRKDFGDDPKDRLEFSIGNSMDEVMQLSKGIYQFGRERQISEKTLHILSLCIEEMAGNVVQHAFKPGEKRWLDLSIAEKPDALIVRIRDNGAAFDPLAYLSNYHPDRYGIRMIHALAQSFEYRRSLGLNNLIIRINKKQRHLNSYPSKEG